MFNEKMAVGIGYRLLELAGGQLPHLKFMKLMYLVEREWMRFSGVTITGDRLKNMKDGPMLSSTYDCMKAGFPNRRGIWWQYLSQIDRRTVRILGESKPPQSLTRRQMQTVEAVWNEFGGVEEQDLIELTHRLPEYNWPGTGSVDVPLEKVFAAFGYDEENVEDMVARYRDREALQNALGSVV